MNRTVEAARKRGLPAVAVTFDPHPREILTPGRVPPLITTPGRKAAAIEALGVQTLVVLEFDDELSRLPSEGFARRVIAEGLDAVHVVVGANFTFGHRALARSDRMFRPGAKSSVILNMLCQLARHDRQTPCAVCHLL